MMNVFSCCVDAHAGEENAARGRRLINRSFNHFGWGASQHDAAYLLHMPRGYDQCSQHPL